MGVDQIIDTFYSELRSPHYVNGRLLRAVDLSATQEVTLKRFTLLGRANGSGIAEGLWVSSEGIDALNVSAGLGVNPEGSVIYLSLDRTIKLRAVKVEPIVKRRGNDRFRECEDNVSPSPRQVKSEQTFQSKLPDGAYLLTARPVYRLQGAVANRSFYGTRLEDGCADQWEEEGVEFHLFQLDEFEDQTISGESLSVRRSRLAYWCYANAQLSAYFNDPASTTGETIISKLAESLTGTLSPRDLPLAVFDWTDAGGIRFVDNWSVRRRMSQPNPAAYWEPSTSDDRAAEGQARFYQFQEQLQEELTRIVQADGDPTKLAAIDYFYQLPPVGFVPIDSSLVLDERTGLSEYLYRLLYDWFLNTKADPAYANIPALDEKWVADHLQAMNARGIDPVVFFARYGNVVSKFITQDTANHTLNLSWWDEPIVRIQLDDLVFWVVLTPLIHYLKEQMISAETSKSEAPPVLYALFMRSPDILESTRQRNTQPN
jgi:hypothetical protein